MVKRKTNRTWESLPFLSSNERIPDSAWNSSHPLWLSFMSKGSTWSNNNFMFLTLNFSTFENYFKYVKSLKRVRHLGIISCFSFLIIMGNMNIRKRMLVASVVWVVVEPWRGGNLEGYREGGTGNKEWEDTERTLSSFTVWPKTTLVMSIHSS